MSGVGSFMITVNKTKCKVCGEEVPYTNVKDVPNTCWRKMCQTNYTHSSGRTTIQGGRPSAETKQWTP